MSSGLIGVSKSSEKSSRSVTFSLSLVCSLRDLVVGSFRINQLVDRDQF